MRSKSLTVAFLLVILALVLVVEPLPVHAASSIVQQNSALCIRMGGNPTCGATLSAPFSNNVASGNVVVVAVVSNDNPANPAPTVVSVGDSRGSSFTQAVWWSGVERQNASIYYAVLSSSGSDTVTVTFSSTPSEQNGYAYLFIYEVSGVTTTGVATGKGSGASGSVSTSSTAFDSGAFLVAVVVEDCVTGEWTVGSGFTLSPTPPYDVNVRLSMAEYAIPGVSSSTTFPATLACSAGGAGNWVEVGIALNAKPVIMLNPTCGLPGTRVEVTGADFVRHANSFCEIHSDPAGLVGATRGTDFDCNILNDGSVSGLDGPAFFVVAAGASGSYSVTVYYAPPSETPQESAPVGFSTQCGGGTTSGPVGGFMMPVNKVAVFAPYLALLGVIGAVAVIYWKRPDN